MDLHGGEGATDQALRHPDGGEEPPGLALGVSQEVLVHHVVQEQVLVTEVVVNATGEFLQREF